MPLNGPLLALALAIPAPALIPPPGTRPPADAPPPATRPATRAAEQEAPHTEIRSLSELFTTRMVDDFLLVELRGARERSKMYVRPADLAGASAQLVVRGPTDFKLILERQPATEDSAEFTHLYVGPREGELNIARDSESGGETLNVHLAQLRSSDEREPAVRLGIDRASREDETRALSAHVEAESFTELAHRHPEVFEEFVRPMLRDLGLAGALDYDIRAAALQVFLEQLPVDEATQQRVEALLPGLDASDYRQREEAQRHLAELGRPGASALLKIARQRQLTAEQMQGMQAVLAPLQPLEPAEAARRREDIQFLRAAAGLSGEPDDAELSRLARERLAELGAPETASAPGTRPTR